MQLKDFVNRARRELSSLYDGREASAMTDILCGRFFGLQSFEHILNPELELDAAGLDGALSALKRLCGGEPLQYVLGCADFFGREFKVNPSVLIPRPETEIMCSEAISVMKGREKKAPRILDLCTGSGCIAWTMALELPEASVVAVDISSEAILTASSQSFSTSRSPHFVRADIFDDGIFDVLGEGFDMVLSNPPYILESEKTAMRPNVLNHEPGLALFVPDADPMLFNRRIAEICKKILYTDAVVFVEINDALARDTELLFSAEGFRDVKLTEDFNRRRRFIRFSK